MTWTTRLFLIWLLAGLAVWAPTAHAARGQAIENTKGICLDAARAMERREGIPTHLLGAIALTESGRFDAESGENFAWPWTVTAQGKGRYFASEAQARAEVEILLTQGVKNIDVGCMQINLHYHWDAFKTLEDAFDPRANAAYAAKFLKSKYDEAKNWLTAAGRYHSHTPENFRPYRIKVLSYWNRLKRGDGTATAAGNPAANGEAGEGSEDETQLVAIDQDRTARLNAMLKEKRREERLDMRALGETDRRMSQLDEWRERRRHGVRLQAVVARRLAEMEVRRQERLKELDRATRDISFAERRRQQLQRWRNTGSLTGGDVILER